MGVLAFDTHKAVKVLQDAGADEHLAEAVVNTIGSAMGENVATKADTTELKAEIAELKAATKAEIAESTAATKAEIAESTAATKADTTKLKADIDELKAATKAEIAESTAATKADTTKLKADIDELKAATKAEIAELKISTKAEIAELKVWLLGHLWVAVGVIIAALSLLAYLFLPTRPG